MKKRFIITTFLMLLFVSVALSTASYAWFTMSNTNVLDEFTIQARAASGGLEISLDGSTFYSDSVSMVSPTLKAMDVTSPDGVQFFKASDTDSKGIPTGYTDATAGTDYYEFNLYFRTSSAGYITLDGDNCYVEPYNNLTENGTNASTNPKEVANKSSFGEFSRNYIAAAVRTSLKVTGSQNSTSNTWETANDNNVLGTVARYIMPDNTYEGASMRSYMLTQDSTTSEWTIDTTSHDETSSVKKGNSAAILYASNTILTYAEYSALSDTQQSLVSVETSGDPAVTTYTVVQDIYSASKYNLNGTAITPYGWGTYTGYALVKLGDETAAEFTGGTSNIQTTVSYTEGNIQITKVTCRIWIEGQDNEAKLALALGKFCSQMTFKFIPAEISDVVRLSSTTAVADSGRIAKWSSVGGAESYNIYKLSNAAILSEVANNAGCYQIAEGHTLSELGTAINTKLTFQNNLDSGEYVIQAISSTNNADINSYFTKFTVKQLMTPDIEAITTENNEVDTEWQFKFATITNAEKYQISSDGNSWSDIVDVDTDNDYITFKCTSNGTYYIKAVPATGSVYVDSQQTSIVVEMHTQLDAPENVAVANDTSVLTWDKVTDATGYIIKKDNVTVATIDGNTVFTYTIGQSADNNGNYTVIAIGDESKLINDSEASAVAKYTFTNN